MHMHVSLVQLLDWNVDFRFCTFVHFVEVSSRRLANSVYNASRLKSQQQWTGSDSCMSHQGPLNGATVAAGSLRRFVLNQDTGGAIRGAVRADYFWGFGDEAGAQAGRMRQSGRMWVLLPNDYPLPGTSNGNGSRVE